MFAWEEGWLLANFFLVDGLTRACYYPGTGSQRGMSGVAGVRTVI